MEMEFGCKYKEMITGFEGIMTARTTHVTGCDMVKLTDNEGEEKWFSCLMVEYVSEGISEKFKDAKSYNMYDDLDESLYNLGDKAKDKITEFEGVIIAMSCPLVGDISYALSPKYDGNVKDNNSSWFDEGRIELIKDKDVEIDIDKKRVGGVTPNLVLR